jgi:hypothetical protein
VQDNYRTKFACPHAALSFWLAEMDGQVFSLQPLVEIPCFNITPTFGEELLWLAGVTPWHRLRLDKLDTATY